MSDRPYWCEICARKKECYGITLKPKCFVPTADRKTEPQTMYYPQVDGITPSVIVKTEPQTEDADCDKCIWSVCNYNKAFAFEDEPQTERRE